MSAVSSHNAQLDHVACVVDGAAATIYCCVCEKYFCDIDNANFHNSNPDYISHLRLRFKPAPEPQIQHSHEEPAPPSPLTPASLTSLSPVSLTPASSPMLPHRIINPVEEGTTQNEEAQHIGTGIAKGVQAFGKGVAEGIAGIVLEPIRGGIDDGAVGALKGAATGIGNAAVKPVRGTGEFLSRTAEGLRNTPTAIFDKDGEHKEHEEIKHVGEGLIAGTKSFGMGLFDGLTGIVMEPVRGAEQDGVAGFFKGVGKGLVGVVCKPVAGAIDLVAKPIEGIANTPGTIADKIDKPKST